MKRYRPPKDARIRSADLRYIRRQKEPRLNKVTSDLKANVSQCGTVIGGRKVWKRGKRTVAPHDKYAFPIIVGGERCPNPATNTKRRDGRNEHRCSEHIGIEWVNTGVVKER